MKKKWFYLLIIALIGIVQLTLMDYFKLFGVKPDLLLISVILASLFYDMRWALLCSVFAGILKDVFGAAAFGINTSLFCLFSFAIIELAKKISIDNAFRQASLVFIISFLYNLTIGIVSIYSGNFIPLGIFLKILFISSAYTALLYLLFFKIAGPVFIPKTYLGN